MMSGDNLHGSQPIKFYSENITITKVLLIQHHYKVISNDQSIADLEEKHNKFKKLLAS